MTGFFVGVDVGGTFTDVALGGGTGELAVVKVVTTPEDPRSGVMEGITGLLARRGVEPASVSRVVHGTTLATNVILERRGVRAAFITTAGFGDLVRLGREFRSEDERFDLFFRPPAPPISRRLSFELRERMSAGGEVIIEPSADEVEALAAAVAATAPEAVAVCLLHAHANAAHERLVADACQRALPEAFVVASSDVWPEVREYERAMTTLMCAYIGPVMARYLGGLDDMLHSIGIRCPVEIMESSGGVMSAALAARRPIATMESGGAAGVIAAGFVGRLVGDADVLSFDMGGTTAKTGLVRGGSPDVTHDFFVAAGRPDRASRSSRHRTGSGYPVKIPVVDVAEVGAGGGSIATVDSAGGLAVGPRSSGSVPGPACYGRGGTEPTLTDANLLLGYLQPGPLSGTVSLDPRLAEQALLAGVAGPLRLDPVRAARAVHDIANATMAAAIRMVTVERGIDPRAFTLVAFGGAGPMHAAELAAIFGIGRVVVPRAAGVASALGLIAADLVVDRVGTWIAPLDAVDAADLADRYARMEADAAADLPGGEGALVATHFADLRCVGQAHQLTVAVPPDGVDGLGNAFAEQYRRTYGVEPSAAAELVGLRVRVVREVEKLRLTADLPSGPGSAGEPGEPAPSGERPVWFSAGRAIQTPVYRSDRLVPGPVVPGPALVETTDTTVAVPPGFGLSADPWRNLILEATVE